MLEKDLYPLVQVYLNIAFSPRVGPMFGDFRPLSAVTANSGGNTTGVWSKPDLCLVALWRQKYGLHWNLDVHGFEVKPLGKCSTQSVYEALNHTSLVHYSHLMWHCPDWDERDQKCHSVLEACNRFGVGLITFLDPSDVRSYEIRVPAHKHAPTPDALDEFLETRLEAADRAQLQSWILELQ